MLRVIDNSGATWIRCFDVLRKRRNVGRIGDVIVGSVREVRALEDTKTNSRVQRVTKGQVVHAVVVRCAKETRREDGTYVRYWDYLEFNSYTLMPPF